ncbi:MULTISPECIES: type II toxin-antitoxin system HicA family toxin [Sphingomonas]|uniref:type II toxin-antitoxin system HicA family toxin n=1 Tax=Sphingomonas TaxID=13687 RepID=UPI00083134E7|nr:type II toxin-antitoxin system HicA family toxin [Sphingomonas sp. CCH10-B3]
MTKIGKLHAWILANPRSSIPFPDFERLVVAFGFELRRTTGSHRQYARPDIPYVVNIQPRGKEAKSYQIQQFLAICDQYALTLDD